DEGRRIDQRPLRRGAWYLAEAPLARLIIRNRREQVGLVEVRPERVGEVQLRVRGRPDEEVADAELAARADEEVDRADLHGGEDRAEQALVDALGIELALRRALGDLARRVRDLLAAAVGQRERQRHPIEARGLRLHALEDLGDVLRQPRAAADGAQADALVDELVALRDQELLEELHQRRHLEPRALPVLLAEGVERQRSDAEAAAGADRAPDRLAALAVAERAEEPLALRPAAVAVHDDGHVLRQVAQVDEGHGRAVPRAPRASNDAPASRRIRATSGRV